MEPTRGPFLRAIQISKRYGGVEALQHLDLDIFPGEVIGVVGDTDSGKSTLLRLLSGSMRPDGGWFVVEGRRVRLDPSYRAARYGITIVHQDINYAEHMTGLSYIFASQPHPQRAPLRWIGWWNPKEMLALAQPAFERLGFEMPPLTCRLHDLTSAQRKTVAFVKATIAEPRLLLLDEPVNSLEAHKEDIFRLIETLRESGRTVLLVTQNLEDVFRVATRIVVLNDGHKIAERPTAQTSEEEIVHLILGSVDEQLTPAVWALSNYFEVRRQAEELDRLNQALARRAAQLQAHAEVARSATSILDRDELLTTIVRIIRQRFEYDHTAIYLVDDGGQTLILGSSASRDDALTLPADTRISIDDDSALGWCATHGQFWLANDVPHTAAPVAGHILPGTQAELVLPLRIGKRILGVLDLQSNRPGAFVEEDVQALQGLADQLAIAIRNAELFDALRVARQQADEANRYKSIFLSNMSHELRTPLTAIIGHTQAMLSPGRSFYHKPIPEEYYHDLDTIRKSGEHLLALINDVLDLTQIESGQLKLNLGVVDLKPLLDRALQTASGLVHGRPIALRACYPDELPPLWADPLRTSQIILNLLSNAAKFTEQGEIRVDAEVGADSVVISVSDTGIGIPEHLHQAIFDRFSRGEIMVARKYGGTGLGLSISQQLAALQHGSLTVSSTPGTGSTFRVSLPRATPEQIATAGGYAEVRVTDPQRAVLFTAPAPAADSARLILLAQDETRVALALRQALEAAGYVVELAGVEELVVEMAEVIGPDMIVIDATSAKGEQILRDLLALPDARHTAILAVTTGDAPLAAAAAERPAPCRQISPAQCTPAYVLAAAQEWLGASA
mgnify:CR=1 FL=1